MKYFILSILATVAPLIGVASVANYASPAEAKLNDAFSVEVCVDGGQWEQVPTYLVMVDEVVDARHTRRNTSMAYFDSDEPTQVRVVSRKQRVETARIRPLSYNITPSVDGDTLAFTVAPGQLMSVEVNGDIFNNLQLFVNGLDKNAPTPKQLKKLKKDKNYIYFGPGYHKIDSIALQSGQTLYVAGGAVIDGRVVVHDCDGAKVLGRGMIYPLQGNKMGIHIARSKNVEVDGVFTTQCAVGGSDHVEVTNVKVMSYYGWGDGFNVFASSNVHYDNCWARTSDDCTTVYCTRLGHAGSSHNIVMERSVLWADVAHPFMIGLHGSFNAATPDSVTHVVYRDIDILDVKEKQLDYQGVFAIVAGDNNLVKDVLFDNIRVEDFRQCKLFDIRIAHNSKYCKFPGRGIEDITFKDIVYNGGNSEISLIIGYDQTRRIKNITFDNLLINGLKISDDMEGKPKWYKTGDMARIFIGEHVDNVVFK